MKTPSEYHTLIQTEHLVANKTYVLLHMSSLDHQVTASAYSLVIGKLAI